MYLRILTSPPPPLRASEFTMAPVSFSSMPVRKEILVWVCPLLPSSSQSKDVVLLTALAPSLSWAPALSQTRPCRVLSHTLPVHHYLWSAQWWAGWSRPTSWTCRGRLLRQMPFGIHYDHQPVWEQVIDIVSIVLRTLKCPFFSFFSFFFMSLKLLVMGCDWTTSWYRYSVFHNWVHLI